MMNALLSDGEWIAASYVGSPHTPAPVPCLRRSFILHGRPRSAVLWITALGLYECEINGRRVGNFEFTPGWTDYHKRLQVQSYDVAPFLNEGENVVGVLLGDGWYCGTLGWIDRQNYGSRPALLAVLEIALENGATQRIATDLDWQFRAGPIFSSDVLQGESYDARRELAGWSTPGFQAVEWLPVEVVRPEPVPALVHSFGALVQRQEVLRPVQCEKLEWPLGWRFDFGQNFAGRIRLRVKAPRGTLLSIVHGEMRYSDGTIYTENLKKARATDYYTCKGEGIEEWEPRFTYHGFQYVEVIGGFRVDNQEPELLEVEGIVLHSAMERTGHFSCSNPLLNQLQQNILWSQKSNFFSVPTDCPQRSERLGWTGDAQVFIRTAAFNFDVEAFFRKWFYDLEDAQSANGGIPGMAPCPSLAKLDDGGPGWSDAVVICPWVIYERYGDKAVLEKHYEMMQRYLSFVKEHRSIEFIRSHPDIDRWGYGDWLALDGDNNRGATPQDLIGTAFYAYDAFLMQKIAKVLGRECDSEYYRVLHFKVAEAFRHRFVSPEGFVVAGTQTAYVLALSFDLLLESQRPVAARELVRHIQKRGNHLSTGFVGTPLLLDALSCHGAQEVAYALLEQESYPSWLFPVKNGATTIWERWDGWTPERGFQDKTMNSFNHYAYGAVGDWMVRTVAGLNLDPENPGYRHIIFKPQPGGSLTWAEARLKTRHGDTSIRWERDEQRLEVFLSIPKECRGTFLPPASYPSENISLGPGEHQFHLFLSP